MVCQIRGGWINFREDWRGHLWQGRFASYLLDEPYLFVCARYIEMNPVRAGLVAKPMDWQWSSARAYHKKKNDKLVNIEPLMSIVKKDWAVFLGQEVTSEERENLQKHERTGRPLGDVKFIERLEKKLNVVLKAGKSGPKPKSGGRG